MAILDAKARDLPSDNDFLFVLSPRSKIHLRILLSQETMITRMAAGCNGDCQGPQNLVTKHVDQLQAAVLNVHKCDHHNKAEKPGL